MQKQNENDIKLSQVSKEYAEIQKFLNKSTDPVVEKIRRYLNEIHIQRIELHSQNEELRSMQNELQLLQNEYYELYNNAPIGYVVLDKNAIIHKCNIRFQNCLGYVASDILNKPLNKFIKEDKDFLAIYKSFFKKPQNKIFEYEFIKADGSYFYGRIMGTIMHNSVLGNNYDNKLFLVINDISAQKYYQEQTEILLKNKSKFISTMAHDIRNPLGSIIGYSQFLLDEHKSLNNSELNDCFNSLNRVSKNLNSFVNNFMNLSKIDFDLENIKLEVIEQNDILKQLIKSLEKPTKDKNIKITFQDDLTLECLSNDFMAETVYRNILTNAIKFTEPNGNITIKTYKKENYGCVEITDSGIGISKEKLNEILAETQPSISTTGTNNEIGSGLGLLICKEYVNKMQGKLDIKSVLNKGTTITVSLLLE
ncbi:MAG: hypothetical protein CR986_01050 [Ignavibacteriae bacterium]|nr:MAG: hypothetical protein CR986_01050 [Ignavibacteriota bacterium]